jgi:hypothetical protein
MVVPQHNMHAKLCIIPSLNDGKCSDATTSTVHGSDENGIDGISFQGEDGAHEKDGAATVLDTVNELIMITECHQVCKG